MLFGNKFEKALIAQYIVSPFNGYSIDKNTAFIDLLFDFCSSVAHNGVVFPNGINKRDQAKVFYSSYALAIILACSKNENQSEEISGGATRAFANTAKQNGMSQQQILEKLSYILDCFEGIGKEIDAAHPEKQGAYAAMAFLSQVGVKPTKENIYAMYSLYDKFFEAYTKWDGIVNGTATKTIQQELIDYLESHRNPKEIDDYIESVIRPAFYKTDYNKTKAVLGVIAMAERNKELALAKYDALIKWWLEIDEQSDEQPNTDIEIAFYDGLLEANNVVSKQEFDAFHQRNTELANEMVERKIKRWKEQSKETHQNNSTPIDKKREKPQAEQLFDLMEGFLSSFLRKYLSDRGTSFSIGALLGIANAIYLLIAESISAKKKIVESDIAKHTVDALHLNRYSEETIDSIMKIRIQISSEYYKKGSGMPISDVIEGIAYELVEYFGKQEIELDYASVRSSLSDYQQEIVTLLGAEDKE